MKRYRCWMMSVLLTAFLAGCHTQKKVYGTDTDITRTGETDPTGPQLLLLSGTFSYNSIANTFHLDIESQRVIEGNLNLEDAKADTAGLHYRQLAADGTVLRVHHWDNPLRRDVEYPGAEGFERRTVVLPEVSVFIRVPLDRRTRQVIFRHGRQMIQSINIQP